MAASESITTTLQYPIWIEDGKIHCDEAGLLSHLTQNLHYSVYDAIKIMGEITKHINGNLQYFWDKAARNMSTESIRVILQSVQHSQLNCMLSYPDSSSYYTALNCCACNLRSDMIKMILDNVNEDECYSYLGTTEGEWGVAPIHWSCSKGDTESVRAMLYHLNQDKRYSLLQKTQDVFRNTPLHDASFGGHTGVMKVVHESVTQTQWINLLELNGFRELTVLQIAAYQDRQSCIETIRDSVSDEVWIKLLSTPLPEYQLNWNAKDQYQRALSKVDELRAAAKVQHAIITQDNTGLE